MADVMTTIILVLFFIFVAYFLYTIFDVFYISKKKRKVKSPVEKSSKHLHSKESSEKNESDLTEEDNLNETLSIGKDSHEKVAEKDSDNPDDKDDTEIASKKLKRMVIKTKFAKLKSSLFSLRSRIFKKSKDTQENKIDKVNQEYNRLIAKFVHDNNKGWTEDKYYHFLLDISKKGFDRRPSELLEDLEIAKKEFYEEKRLEMEANFSSKSSENNLTESSFEDKYIDEIKSEFSKDEALDKNDTKKDEIHEDGEAELSEEFDPEKELKILTKKNKTSLNTRQELDRTLEEIRMIRKRLTK